MTDEDKPDWVLHYGVEVGRLMQKLNDQIDDLWRDQGRASRAYMARTTARKLAEQLGGLMCEAEVKTADASTTTYRGMRVRQPTAAEWAAISGDE